MEQMSRGANMPNKRAGLGVKIPITWCFRVHFFNKSRAKSIQNEKSSIDQPDEIQHILST